MLNVKLSTCAPDWPWYRQTPSNSYIWEDIHFHINNYEKPYDAWVVFESLQTPQTSICPADRTIFVSGEPTGIGSYSSQFLNQFAKVISSREDIKHQGLIHRQQGHPWFVEKNYDELVNMPPAKKSADVCLITSDKIFTQGHRDRLSFALDLKAQLGSKLDIWGRGIRDFESTWDVLSRYRYAIVMENLRADDWLTEKLPDAMLAWCVPLYLGCKNVSDYLPLGSWIDISSLDASGVANKIEELLKDNTHYESCIPYLHEARLQYLHNLQFFANLKPILYELCSSPSLNAEPLTLYPQHLVPVSIKPIEDAEVTPQRKSSFYRKAAGLLRIPAWKMLECAEKLSPLPVTKAQPTALPVSEPPPLPTLKEVAYLSWLRSNGDKTLRLDYDISNEDVVIDVGGYEGQWVSDIFSRYMCSVHVFEPVPNFAKSIERRFVKNKNVYVHQAALGAENGVIAISIDGDASSALIQSVNHIEVPVLCFSEVFVKHGWKEIALMKINIEGGEYDLLQHILDSNLAKNIKNIQVQFHDFVPDASSRMIKIQERLRATHELTYYFPFIWENWKLKDID